MRLDWNDITARAHHFVALHQKDHYEKGETQSFYNEFFEVFGVPRRRVASFEKSINLRAGERGFIDLFWPGKLLVEQKSAGRDLKKAKEQAFNYFPGLRDDQLPRYLLLSDFQNFELYDLDTDPDKPVSFPLTELPNRVRDFGFIVGEEKRAFKDQDPVNIAASEMMGALHDALEESGYQGHDLEQFLVRLLFCLFADDTGIFNPLGSFEDYIRDRTQEDGSDVGPRLGQLFEVLNTPRDKRQKTLDADLDQFEYINGDLFKERLPLPAFNRDMRDKLLYVCSFSWQKISPAIFGSLFQSVMDKGERRKKGAHYTTEKNILKVIEPLFLDELRADLTRLIARRDNGRQKALEEFHDRLSRLTFFDPACGCGNFLVIAYREIRLIENEVMRELYPRDQFVTDIGLYTKVNVDQFYGIEIEEFPARIAEVALWMMDHIMNARLSADFGQSFLRIPLKASPNIRHGDALQLDWAEILPPERCSYVLGNPPFIGQSYQSKAQRRQMAALIGGKGGSLDFVCAWFVKAGEYVRNASLSLRERVSAEQTGEGLAVNATDSKPSSVASRDTFSRSGEGSSNTFTRPRIGFVATNSICQGEQVAQLWPILFERFKLEIAFAHRTFEWMSDAKGKAHVHCVILGLVAREDEPKEKRLFSYDDIKADPIETRHGALTAYLRDGGALTNRFVVIRDSRHPLTDRRRMMNGPKATENGILLFSSQTKCAFEAIEPISEKFFKKYLGSEEYINGHERWILFLKDISPVELGRMQNTRELIERVKRFRAASKKSATQKLANFPTLLEGQNLPKNSYLAIPQVSSEKREYIPIGFLSNDTIPSDKLRYVENADLYDFAVLTSRMHMAWMRAITGRMKSDYMYSVGVVYNNFPWPEADEATKDKIRLLAQAILDARAAHEGATLADLYDPLTMPPDLRKAHQALDGAIDRLYRRDPFPSDRERVEHLFGLYEKLTATLFTEAPKKRGRKR
jgi:hypothetical protein